MVDQYGHRLPSFSLRMEKPTRKSLEKHAKKNGNTLTDEIITRLECSFEEQEAKANTLKSIEESLAEANRKLDILQKKT